MLSMHLFIISWEGQHEKAISIAKSIFSATNQISIVYSDPNSDLTLDVDCQCIRRPNELFWGDKFKACLDVCDSDLMVVIHADCDCEDWSFLVHKCRSAMDQNPIIAVWAPLIDWTQWNIHRTRLYEIRSTSFTVVAQTDAIVFCLSKAAMNRLRRAKFEGNVYGWGIDTMAVAYAYANGMLAVVDKSVRVNHPKSRGYPSEAALAQCNEFLKQLTLNESIQNRLLWSFISAQSAQIAAAQGQHD
ncbi:MAG: hypothetical protein ACLQUZ_19100 [Rhizomicrobium sp.]